MLSPRPISQATLKTYHSLSTRPRQTCIVRQPRTTHRLSSWLQSRKRKTWVATRTTMRDSRKLSPGWKEGEQNHRMGRLLLQTLREELQPLLRVSSSKLSSTQCPLLRGSEKMYSSKWTSNTCRQICKIRQSKKNKFKTRDLKMSSRGSK